MKFIGDIVLTTPVIRSIRAAYPDAHIAYLGDSKAVTLLEQNPYLNEIIPFDFSKDSFGYQMAMYWKMYRGKYDLAIDLFSNPRSALMTFATRAGVRIGGDSKSRGRLYTIRVKDDGVPKSAVEYHFQSLKQIGIPEQSHTTEIFLLKQETEYAAGLLTARGINLQRKTVALHPGGTWPAKLWQKEKYAELAQKLMKKNIQVVLTGGPNDIEAVEFVRSHSGAVPLGILPLRTIASMYSHCNAVVSNDCGVMHIAVAVGTPTVGIFGPGEDLIWFPYPSPHKALRKHVSCNPCHLDVCNRTGAENMECMKLLSAEEVYSTVLERI